MLIVDSHHKVLPGWAALRATLPQAPRLITLDHHTDTSRPFRNHIRKTFGAESASHEALRAEWLQAIDFRQPQTVADAMAKLSNDEHVVAAIKSDIISAAFVVAHNAMDTGVETYREHRIMCRSVSRNSPADATPRADCDKVIESAFLDECLSAFDEALRAEGESALLAGPYILDIDLDYFNTFASVAPTDASILRKLAEGASMVTIATEPAYVHACALDPDLTSDQLLARLLALVGTVPQAGG